MLSINREMLAFLTESLRRRPEIIPVNAAFLQRWTSAVPRSHGLDQGLDELGLWVASVEGEEDTVQEPNECPICQEALSVLEGGDASGSGEELRCEMWHIWSELVPIQR